MTAIYHLSEGARNTLAASGGAGQCSSHRAHTHQAKLPLVTKGYHQIGEITFGQKGKKGVEKDLKCIFLKL